MDLYFLKTFFGGLISRGLEQVRVLFRGAFIFDKNCEVKICWDYKWVKTFVVNVKRMWTGSKLKDFIVFIYCSSVVFLPFYNGFPNLSNANSHGT